MAKSKYGLVILGAGTGGISAAARLSQKLPAGSIALIDPSDAHYYQPLWTLVGGGVAKKESTRRNQKDLIPSGVDWLREKVQSIDPTAKTVTFANGNSVAYDSLLVATGLRLQWEKIPGIEGHLGKNGLCSIYEYEQVDKVTEMLENFQGGTAIFTMPPVPIKCAGAPQKIMYLADEIFRRGGVREKAKIHFATAGKAMFGVPVFAQALDKVVAKKNIEPLFAHRLKSVNASAKTAVFAVTGADGQTTDKEMKYDLLHVVPPMGAHSFIADSPLAAQDGDQKGWLAVDKFTLQHLRYPNVFGIGDVTGVPNSKTGAAIRKQAPVVVENLLAVMNGKTPTAKYDGYSSCPLVTGFGKVILAEFGYDGKLMPSFPMDMTKERRSMWHLKKDFLPILYWQGMLKGRA